MSNDTHSPAFPEGSMVRDRETGLEYTATGETIPGNGQPAYWSIVTGADGVERQLPACDLEPVAARISNATSADELSSFTDDQIIRELKRRGVTDLPPTDDDVLRARVSGAQFFPGMIQAAPLPVLASVLGRVKAAL